jgi:hypothetical protein
MNYLWRAGQMRSIDFVAVTGESVAVVSEGEGADDVSGVWTAAEVVVDGERRRGTVAVGASVPVPDGAVLRVVEDFAPPVLGTDDRLVPQIVCPPPSEAAICHDALVAGAGNAACAGRVAAMLPPYRTSLLSALLVDRLRRKTERIGEIFGSAAQDWNQTFHVLLMQAMGGDRNRDAFTSLAGRATAAMVAREKNSVTRVEALLLGSAGFLFGGRGADTKDDYTLALEEEARHLLAKYSIVPMRPAEWNLAKLYPANHPAVRLAEIAAMLSKKDFMLDGVLDCRTSEDVERLFSATASDYWRTHYTPSGGASAPSAKTIGRAKARLVGINLVAPLVFAYGRATGGEELCERALDLLTDIPAEKNRLLEGWYAGGCEAGSAFESQALLQLTSEYCAKGACADCRIGRTEIKNALAHKTYANNE